MKTIRRAVLLLLSVFVLVSAFVTLSVGAHADEYSGQCGDNLYWKLDIYKSKLTITGFGDMYDYESTENMPWKNYRHFVKKIIFDADITSIGNYAFKKCPVTEVDIPNGVTKIGDGAFWRCEKLQSVTIPDGVKKIGDSAFWYCDILQSVTIPDGVTAIGSWAFQLCSSLETIVIPGSVKTVSNSSFSDTGVNTVTLKEGVEIIDINAFKNCTSLSTLYFPHSLKKINQNVFDNDGFIRDIYYDGYRYDWIEINISNNQIKSSFKDATVHCKPDNSIDSYTVDLSNGKCRLPAEDYPGIIVSTLAAAKDCGGMDYKVDSKSNLLVDVQRDGSYDIKIRYKSYGEDSGTYFYLLAGNSFDCKNYDYEMSESEELFLLRYKITDYTRSISFIIPKNPFKDVPGGKWYTNAVVLCSVNGYMTGTSATTFEPNSAFTRAMFVTVLAKIDGADTDGYTGSSFSDVPQGKWYSKPIQWAYEKGYTSGLGGGKFGPNSPVTREQLAQFLYNYTQKKGWSTYYYMPLAGYPDTNDISEWALNAIRWAMYNGLISGVKVGNTVYIQPKGTATRAQVALIVMNYVDKYLE